MSYDDLHQIYTIKGRLLAYRRLCKAKAVACSLLCLLWSTGMSYSRFLYSLEIWPSP
ncbi:hypothetical protein BDV26DRAFT_182967 [Aspergillus bertholletiae]|uniref:Uncharacterized protein n=1 Tax=Aspergillus bertholletiae TaxID=1226010 RepID=A0A5N7BAS2_9EURO|nr:hypothetical protein BDV26DRAFT_182967 [Aspergillus bertholletiae]